tara:strand:+ start:218 stop:1360 length:1143 start_codon:yes stop_codon:yes gene_type:complete
MAKRIWDGERHIDEAKGKFRIRIRRNKSFVVNEVIGDSDVTKKSDLNRVKKIRDSYLAKLLLGNPLHEKRETPEQILKAYTHFEKGVDEFLLRGLKNPTDRTLEDYSKILRNKWGPLIADRRLNEITKLDLEDFFYEKKWLGKKAVFVRDWSPKYRKNLLGPLSKLFNYFEIQPNPCKGVLDTSSVGSRKQSRFKPYKPLEIVKILDRLQGDSKYYFQFAFATGMRHQEILALKWSDIDGSIATVQRCISNYRIEERVKTDFIGREVLLNGSALDAIHKAQTRWGKGFVFPQPDGDYYKKPKRFRLAWIKAHERSSVEYRPMKTTRHTRASELLSKGVNPAKAAKQLGHDKETFLKTYADYLPEYDGGDDSLLESDFADL